MFCVTALSKTFCILLTAVVNELLTIRYDTIRYDTMVYINVRLKADEYHSQLNLPHGTKQKRIMKKLKTKKWRCSEEVRGVSSEAGRESMVGKICEKGRS